MLRSDVDRHLAPENIRRAIVGIGMCHATRSPCGVIEALTVLIERAPILIVLASHPEPESVSLGDDDASGDDLDVELIYHARLQRFDPVMGVKRSPRFGPI